MHELRKSAQGREYSVQSDRIVGSVVTTVGEIMLFLGFFAAGIVLSDGGRLPMPQLEGGMSLVVLAILGLFVSLGASRASQQGGIVANWGANLSLLTTIIIIGRLLQILGSYRETGLSGPLPDVSPFLAGAILLVLFHTLFVNGRVLYGQVRSETGIEDGVPPATLPMRWGLTLLLLLPLL